jgi:predicted transport protein
MPKSVADMDRKMIQNLEEKSGKKLDEWINIARSSKIEKYKALIKWLQENHELTYGYGSLVARYARQSDNAIEVTGDDLIASQYAGAKDTLRPFYDAIIKAVKQFGNDLEISPKKKYVSLRRSKQFAIIQPSTKTRLDLGIKLKDIKPTSRLEEGDIWSGMVTHRVKIQEIADIDAELIGWLRKAYEEA